jgi:hypothetical protein
MNPRRVRIPEEPYPNTEKEWAEEMNPIEIEWTRRLLSGIARYFKNRGYDVESIIVDGSKIEKEEGIDAVVIVGGKILGIQTKRPIQGRIESYKLDEKQYNTIKIKDWVYFAFPEDISPVEYKNILHRTIFSRGGFRFKSTVKFNEISDGISWRLIAKGIEECTAGLRIESDENRGAICSGLEDLISGYLAIFSINAERGLVRVAVGNDELLDGRVFRDKYNGGKVSKKKSGERIKTKKEVICPECGKRFTVEC